MFSPFVHTVLRRAIDSIFEVVRKTATSPLPTLNSQLIPPHRAAAAAAAAPVVASVSGAQGGAAVDDADAGVLGAGQGKEADNDAAVGVRGAGRSGGRQCICQCPGRRAERWSTMDEGGVHVG